MLPSLTSTVVPSNRMTAFCHQSLVLSRRVFGLIMLVMTEAAIGSHHRSIQPAARPVSFRWNRRFSTRLNPLRAQSDTNAAAIESGGTNSSVGLKTPICISFKSIYHTAQSTCGKYTTRKIDRTVRTDHQFRRNHLNELSLQNAVVSR